MSSSIYPSAYNAQSQAVAGTPGGTTSSGNSGALPPAGSVTLRAPGNGYGGDSIDYSAPIMPMPVFESPVGQNEALIAPIPQSTVKNGTGMSSSDQTAEAENSGAFALGVTALFLGLAMFVGVPTAFELSGKRQRELLKKSLRANEAESEKAEAASESDFDAPHDALGREIDAKSGDVAQALRDKSVTNAVIENYLNPAVEKNAGRKGTADQVRAAVTEALRDKAPALGDREALPPELHGLRLHVVDTLLKRFEKGDLHDATSNGRVRLLQEHAQILQAANDIYAHRKGLDALGKAVSAAEIHRQYALGKLAYVPGPGKPGHTLETQQARQHQRFIREHVDPIILKAVVR